MIEKALTVGKNIGIRNRGVTYLVQKANEFRAAQWIEVDSQRANAKSLLGIVALNLNPGMAVKLTAAGEDEEQAIMELASVLGD